jgi:hypothetical protein
MYHFHLPGEGREVFIKAEDGQREWRQKQEGKGGMQAMKSATST